MKTIKARRFSFRREATLALSFACAAVPSYATAATIHGNTDEAVLWVSNQPSAIKAADGDMRNRGRTFIPPYIVIAAGSSVTFPNDDPFYHSIYSDSKVDPFDIGYYNNGPGKSVTFQNPGIVDVHCHIHAFMHATIIVADGPFTTASNGTYQLQNVLPGKVSLHAWNPDNGTERVITLDVPNANSDVTQDVRR
jgi:plastocyanin